MTLQPVSQTTVRFAKLATSGLLMIQATIATIAISTSVSTSAVLAQEVKTNDQSVQLSKTNKLSLKAMDLLPSPAATCWAAAAENCSYNINTAQLNRISQYPSGHELNELSTPATVALPQAAMCLTDAAPQNCSYSINASSTVRINPYPLEQLSVLPNFDPPASRVILVRIPF